MLKSWKLCLLFIIPVLGLQAVEAGTERWMSDLRYPIRFQRLLAQDLLLVSTQRHTFALDPDSGRTTWRFRNLEIFPEDVHFFPEEDLLIISEGWGGVMRDTETTLLAIKASSGQLLWESMPLPVKILDLVAAGHQNRLLAVGAPAPHQRKGGRLTRPLTIYLLNGATGEFYWKHDLREATALASLGERKGMDGRDYQFYGLHAHWAPQFTDQFIYLFYDGAHCLDLASGKLRWKQVFPASRQDLIRSTARPLLTSDRIYLSGRHRIFALNPYTGKMIWTSSEIGGVSTLHEAENVLYARIGGQFLDLSGNTWKTNGPAGLIRLDRENGQPYWQWKGAGDSISNVILDNERLFCAGEKRFFVLDPKTGREIMSFLHEMDPAPRFVGLNEAGNFVLLGDGQVASFDRLLATPQWRHRLESPESGLWKSLTGGLLSVAGSLLVAASYGLTYQRDWIPDIPAPLGDLLDYERRVIRMGRMAGISLLGTGRNLMRDNRFSEIENARLYALSREPGSKEWGILGLNLNDGRIDQFVSLDPFENRFIISGSLRRVFRVENSTIYAIDFIREPEPSIQGSHEQP